MSSTDGSDEWRARIEADRERKRQLFRESERSPLPPSMRGEQFPGLDFFDPDPEYRFVVPLHEHDDPNRITVGTTADGKQTYLQWGEFRFDADGERHTLQAYRPDPETDRLWAPFRDRTNGEETYGAGRYLDLEFDHHRTDAGWVLDFNAAYNPTCAYNYAYECPMVPMDNWLDIRVEAGERDFPAEPAKPSEHGH